jgi:hypothetical protein
LRGRGKQVANSEIEPQAWVQVLGWLIALPLILATQVWTFWTMWIYLVGGTVPILGWETGTNLVMFLVTLFVFEPLAVMLAQWTFLLVMVPLGLLFHRRIAT